VYRLRDHEATTECRKGLNFTRELAHGNIRVVKIAMISFGPEHTDKKSTYRYAIFVVIGIGAVLFLASPARILECDAVMFAYGALHHDVTFTAYPHHLGYNFLQSVAAVLGRQFSPHLSPIYILQYLSIAAGIAGVLVFYRLLIGLRTDAVRALVYSGVLMFSYGYWHYARQADTHIISAFLLICFAWVCRAFLRRPTHASAIKVGIVLGIATIMHQSNVLLVPVVLVSLLYRDRSRSIIGPIAVFLSIFCVLAVLPYPLVARGLVGVRTLTDFKQWLLGTSTWGEWGAWRPMLLPATIIGLVRTLTGSHYLLGFARAASTARQMFPMASLQDEFAIGAAVPAWLRYPLMVAQAAVLVAAVRSLLRGLASVRGRFSTEKPYAVFLLLWIVVFGVFFAWWSPERVDFWIAWLVPLFLVLAAPASGKAVSPPLPVWKAIGFLACLGFVNFFGSIYPQTDPTVEPDTLAAVAIDAVVEKGDVVISDCAFDGRSSRFAKSFERINLLDAMPSGLTGALADTTIDADDAAIGLTLLDLLTSRSLARIDSLMTSGASQRRTVYILVKPVSRHPTTTLIYNRLLAAISRHYDLSTAEPVRAGVEMRELRRLP
jgi:hypothetical protein